MKTEQFEGHTPGPFVLDNDDNIKTVSGEYVLRSTMNYEEPFIDAKDIDLKLLCAAPDLLAEVRRLQAVNAELVGALREMLEGCGLHNTGCTEYPPGYDSSKCCPVHQSHLALSKASAK